MLFLTNYFLHCFWLCLTLVGLTFAQPIFDVMNTEWQYKKSVSSSATAIGTCSFILKNTQKNVWVPEKISTVSNNNLCQANSRNKLIISASEKLGFHNFT